MVSFIPIIGLITAVVALVGLFVVSIIHAIQVPQRLEAGQPAGFILTPDWIR